MVFPPDYDYFQEFVRQTQDWLNACQNRMVELERKVSALQTELEQVRHREPISIHYKFDQLKIERLEGTLNIGLTPNGSEGNVDAFEVGSDNVSINLPNDPTNDQVMQTPDETPYPIDAASDVVQEVQASLNRYFEEQAIQDIKAIEQKYHYPLDDHYRQFIFNDIKRQLPARISYYLKLMFNQYSDRSALIEEINQRLQTDIVRAIDLFIQHIPKGDVS